MKFLLLQMKVCVTKNQYADGAAAVQDAGFNMAFKPVRVKFKPSAKDVQVCEESGVDLAQAVHRVMRVQERQAGNSQVKQGTHKFGCPGLLDQ